MQKRLLSAVSVLALFGAGCISFSTTPRPAEPAPAPAPVEQPAATAPQAVNALSVSDQIAASTTLITSANLVAPGYIAIHRDVNGVLGPIIGQSPLMQAGTAANIVITVPLASETFYWAMLHTDDGDGVFDATKDPPTKDVSGTVVMQRFEGTSATSTEGTGGGS